MKKLKLIPNILTSLRMVLTFIYLLLLYDLHLNRHNRLYFTLTIIIFVLICLSDFLDGKIARRVKAVSLLGGFLDVAADFGFIVFSLIVLIIHNMIPIWFIVMVLAKFTEFLVTSYIIRNFHGSSNTFFIFDYFGRIAAVSFFLIPGIVSFVYIGLNIMYINIFIYITLILVLISSSERCINCYKILRLKESLIRCDSTVLK